MSTEATQGIVIDAEFADLLPALASAEHEELERSLIEHGRALDPLKVWKETGILIDGHNRLPICEKHDLDYDVVYLSFKDRQAAIEWITRYQLSRRNLTPGQRNEFFEKVYKAHKKAEGGDGTNQHSEELGKIYPVPKHEETPKKTRTSEKIAEQAGVSEKTVRNHVKQAEVVNKIGEHAPKLRKAIVDSPKKVPAKIAEELAGDQELAGRVEAKVKAGVEVVEAVKEVKAESATVVEPECGDPWEEWNKAVDGWAREVVAMRKKIPVGPWADETRANMIESQLRSAAGTLKVVKGYGVCLRCNGSKCERCRHTGYLPKLDLESMK